MIFNNYPYTDFHEINLDWVIKMIKDLDASMDEFKVVNAIEFGGEWDITKNYKIYTIVDTPDHNGYISIKAVPAGIPLSNENYWRQVANYSELYADVQNRIVALENRMDDFVLKYANVESMLSDTDLHAGDIAITAGYYSANDGGGAEYTIRVKSSSDVLVEGETSGQGIIELDNGLIAELTDKNNVLKYGAKGNDSFDNYDIFNRILEYKIAHDTEKIFYVPTGTYRIRYYLQAIRQEVASGVNELNGIVICGDGEKSVIKGYDPEGFDVFQLNGVAHISFKDIAITSVKTGSSTWGCNGISMTSGTHDVDIDNVYVFNLPAYYASEYIDGSKGFTVQQGSAAGTPDCYNITIKNSHVKNCAFGFETSFVGNSFLCKNMKVINNLFEVYYAGVSLNVYMGAAGVSNDMYIDIIGNTIKNAGIGISISRTCNCNIEGNTIISDLTALPGTVTQYINHFSPIIVYSAWYTNVCRNLVNYASAREFIDMKAAYTGDNAFDTIEGNILRGAITSAYAINTHSVSDVESGGYPDYCTFANNRADAAITTINPIVNYQTLHNYVYGQK